MNLGSPRLGNLGYLPFFEPRLLQMYSFRCNLGSLFFEPPMCTHRKPSVLVGVRENEQVPNSGENVHSSVLSEKVPEERTYCNLRGNPRFMYANVRDPPMLKSYFANYFENPKAYSTKITVGNALKTSEATEWIAAMKVEMDQMMETGTLEATKMSDVLPASSIINSTMVLVQKPEKKKARLCACGNELRGKIADLFSPTIGALTYSTVHQISGSP